MTKELIQAQMQKGKELRAEAIALVEQAEKTNDGVLTTEQAARLQAIETEAGAVRAEVDRLVAGLPEDRSISTNPGDAFKSMAKDIFAKRADARDARRANKTMPIDNDDPSGEDSAPEAEGGKFTSMAAGIFAARAARRQKAAA